MQIRTVHILLWAFCCLLPISVQAQSAGSKEQKLLSLDNQISALENKAFELREKIDIISKKIFKGQFKVFKKAQVALIHVSKLGGAFKVNQVSYWLNKQKVFQATESKNNPLPTQKTIYSQGLTPGKYELRVNAKIRGHGYNVFTYMKKYSLEMNSSLKFDAYKGRQTRIYIEFQDKGGKDLRKRVKLVFRKSFKR